MGCVMSIVEVTDGVDVDVNECLAECRPSPTSGELATLIDEGTQRCLCDPLPGATGDAFTNTLLACLIADANWMAIDGRMRCC